MTEARAGLCVMGAFHMDVAVVASRIAAEGETVIGEGPFQDPGGRGAAQAIAAARLGADVDAVGVVGDDDWGQDLRAALIGEGVNADRVTVRAGSRTGVRLVTRLPDGRSSRVVGAGANAGWGPEDVEAVRGVIAAAKVLLVQAELPTPAIESAIAIAHGAGKKVLWHTCAAVGLAPERLAEIDVLVASLPEARAMLELESGEPCSPGGLARRVAALGPRWVALWGTETPGHADVGGGFLFDGERVHHVSPSEHDIRDDCASVDAFAAALAVAVSEDQRALGALRFAVAAAGLCTVAGTVAGTVASTAASTAAGAAFARFPTRAVVERRLAESAAAGHEKPPGALPVRPSGAAQPS